MTLKNYFKIPLVLNQIIQKETNLNIEFKSLGMESEDGERKIFTGRNIYFRPELNTRKVCLLIQNDGEYINERFDYLIDEEWKIFEILLNISVNGNLVAYSYDISDCEQIESIEWIGIDGLEEKFLNFEKIENTVCIQGPKPDKMWGYDMNDHKYRELINRVKEDLEECVQMGKNIILTNGYIGGDVIGYEAAKELKTIYPEIAIVVAVPFLNLDAKWSISARNKYHEMKRDADLFIEIDKVKNYRYGNPENFMKEKFLKKNDFNIDHASAFIVIKDNDNTMNSIIRTAKHHGKYVNEFYFDDGILPFI